MPFINIYFLVFGALTIFGGVMGYVKAGSMASLVAGGVSGLLLLGGAFMLNPTAKPIMIGLAVVCAALAYRFLPAVLKGGGFMPGGLMASLAVVGLVLLIAAFFQAPK